MATTLYSTLLHTLHSKICILHYTLYNLHSALYTLHSALFISGCQGTLLLSPNAIEETAVFIDQGGKRNNLIIFTIYVVAFLHSSRKETEKDYTKNNNWNYQDDFPYYYICLNSRYRYRSLKLGPAFSDLLEKQDKCKYRCNLSAWLQTLQTEPLVHSAALFQIIISSHLK